MNNRETPFSFLVLTFNDDMHLERLIKSVEGLDAKMFIVDSGSGDRTLDICKQHAIHVIYHPFENHPKQWHHALTAFKISTPWVICLDADQVVTPDLFAMLREFDDDAYGDVDGIYFNRKNFHKGTWIKYGGYFPFYMLKMFRVDKGRSDLNENMDHRFIVPGKTKVWKKGYLLEENLKESSIQFWLDKHYRYSDQLAQEEVERMLQLRVQSTKPKFWGNPNERKAFFKNIWWRLPRYLRPTIYFTYRITIQGGFLDGKTGIIFHFLQGFWFRLIVDIKIEELLSIEKSIAKTGTITASEKRTHQADVP